MIYKIEDKFYVKVQGYYVEVDISFKDDNLDITPKGNKRIEVNDVDKVEKFDMRLDEDKNKVINSIKKETKSYRTFKRD